MIFVSCIPCLYSVPSSEDNQQLDAVPHIEAALKAGTSRPETDASPRRRRT
ncbi:hypothetical protein P865_05895 [Brucella abortus 82]|nr:hypothetical protein P408_13410 [Brucella abortus S99]ERM86949.1 hypothetical protein P865_05895 [Brucella abortus 82]EXU84877.1 hypothetical protein AX23_04910 [Brucella melitensis 548]